MTQWDDKEEIERFYEEMFKIKAKLNEHMVFRLDMQFESAQEFLRILCDLRFPTHNPNSKTSKLV